MPKVKVDDSLEMAYEVDDFTDPWRQPETIVLVHGCLKPRQLFYAWIPTLSRHLRVIRPYLRGHHGSTPAPQGHRWTVDSLVCDLKNFLDAVGLDKVHFLGESLGGVLGYHFAYRYPQRLKTLTVVNSPGPSFKHHRMSHYSEVIKREGIEASVGVHAAARVDEMGPGNRALAEWVNDEMVKSPLEATIGYAQAAASAEVNTEEFLPKIRVPSLLLMGAEHTRIVTVEEAERFRDLMPRAKLVTFPGVKAMCQYVIPEKCADEVLTFIREQAA